MVRVKLDLPKLRAARAYKGYTKREVSDMLGYVGDVYGAIENGKYRMTLDMINRICAVLEIDPRDILVFEEEGQQ